MTGPFQPQKLALLSLALCRKSLPTCVLDVTRGFSLQSNSQQQGVRRLTCSHFFVLNQVIRKFRDEELEHHDIGLEHGAELVGTHFPCLLAVVSCLEG